jgi:LmbE family N-acetylglucosaminyl deacetylase
MKTPDLKGKKMLVVMAHPDDESFGMGGTLAHYARRGVEIWLLCATRGEAGSVSAEFLKEGRSIAELREDELRCAAETLGLAKVEFLDFRDSGMAGSADNQHPESLFAAPLDRVAEKVVRAMREFHPDVVVTFDPVGGYHHPDHIKVHQATLRAFDAAGDAAQFPGAGAPFRPGQLYYSIFPRRSLRWIVRGLDFLYRSRLARGAARLFRRRLPDPRSFGRNHDIDLVALAGDADYPQHVAVDYSDVAELKERADACHASQLDFGQQSGSRINRWLGLLRRHRDHFMRAHPETPPRARGRDLFSFPS